MRNVPGLLFVVALLAACGQDAIAPPPPPTMIVKLLVADSAPGFWRGDSLALSALVTRAVNSDGDTVPAPAITWTTPGGFVRTGAQLRATREARGALVASSPGVPAAVVNVAALDDLSGRGPWSSESRCYNSPNGHRGVEDPPIGVDSAINRRSNGAVVYSETEWRTVFKLTIAVDEVVIRFWKDGIVDTVYNRTAIVAMQDTLAVALGTNIGSVPWMKRTSDSPMIYRLESPGICSSDWQGGGTAYELRAP